MLARLSLCVAVAALAAPLRPQESRPQDSRPAGPEPLLWAKVHDLDGWAAEPRLVASWKAAMAEIDQAGKDVAEEARRMIQTLQEAGGRLRWPLETYLLMDGEAPLVGLLAPAGAPPLLAGLSFPTLTLEQAGATETFQGAPFTRTDVKLGPAPVASVLEGAWAERRLALFAPAAAESEGAKALTLFTGNARHSTAMRRIAEQLPAKGMSMIVNFPAVFDLVETMAPEEVGASVKAGAGALLGARCAGFGGNLRVEAGRIVQEAWADLRPGQGILGGFLRKEPRVPSLCAWIAPECEEFVIVDLDMRGVRGLVKWIESFGVPMDPGEWSEELAPLEGMDVGEFLAEHLTGEIGILTRPSTPEQAADPDAEEPVVFLLGSPDGEQALGELKTLMGKFGKEHADLLQKVPDEPLDIYRVGDDADAVLLAARKGFLAVAAGGAESGVLLRKALATGGKGQLPKVFTERLGAAAAAAPCTVLALGHVLSEVSGRVAMREIAGRPMPFVEPLIRILTAGFAGKSGLSATQVVVDAKGARVRSVL